MHNHYKVNTQKQTDWKRVCSLLVLAPSVYQDELIGFNYVIVGRVMQNEGIGAVGELARKSTGERANIYPEATTGTYAGL